MIVFFTKYSSHSHRLSVKSYLDTLTASQPFVATTKSPGSERLPRMVLDRLACSINDLSRENFDDVEAGCSIASFPVEGIVDLWE